MKKNTTCNHLLNKYDSFYQTYDYMLDYILLKNMQHIVGNTHHIGVE